MSANLKAQLKTLLAAKEYKAAIVLLESSTLPDKATYITRIKKRMADDASSTSSDNDEKLKSLIASGDYGQARALLQSIDHPKKAAMLAELDRRIAGIAAPVSPADKPKRKRYTWRRMLVFAVFTVVMLCGAFVFASALAGREGAHQLELQFRMAEVCRKVFEDNYFDHRYTAGQFVTGCFSAAEHSIAMYDEEVNYCIDHQNDTLAIFTRCLAENDVKIDEIWIISAPKDG